MIVNESAEHDSARRHAQRLMYLFDSMGQHRRHATFERLESMGLSMAHMRCLHAMIMNKTMTMKALADHLQITPPSVTTLIRRLVHAELVSRAVSSEDSRVVNLSLTDAGYSLMHELQQQRITDMADLIRGLTPTQQEQFVELLEQAVQAYQNRK